jgi:hypothetical protein
MNTTTQKATDNTILIVIATALYFGSTYDTADSIALCVLVI